MIPGVNHIDIFKFIVIIPEKGVKMSDLKNMTRILKALADEGRLRIVILLVGKKKLCVCEIKELIGLSQPTISSHLRLLENAGILESSKEGLWVNYSLNSNTSEGFRGLINLIYSWLKEDKKLKNDIVRADKVDRNKICKKLSL